MQPRRNKINPIRHGNEVQPAVHAIDSIFYSSLSLAFRQRKLHNIFIFGMRIPHRVIWIRLRNISKFVRSKDI